MSENWGMKLPLNVMDLSLSSARLPVPFSKRPLGGKAGTLESA